MLTFKKLSGPLPLDAYVGMIPMFLDERDLKPAKQQIHEAYGHGGGWNSMNGWSFSFQTDTDGQVVGLVLDYPGDPPLVPRARARLRDETIFVYDHAWVAIVQPDLSVDVARID